jgi:hypothetical protein
VDKNKRNFPRSAINIALSIDIDGKQISGEALDLTVNGLAIKVEESISIGAEIAVSIDENQWVKTKTLRGEVLRCQPAEKGPSHYLLAVKLAEPDDAYLMDSLALIHEKLPPLA